MKSLNTKLILEMFLRTPDGSGGFDGVWSALGVHWGAVDPVSGRFERGETYARSKVRYRVTIRAVPTQSAARPQAGQRFRAGERVFHIRAVVQNGDARFLTCETEEELAS